MKFLFFATLLTLSTASFAADLLEDTTEAIQTAVNEFKDVAEDADINAFESIKTTPATGAVNVTIHLKSRSAWTFSCHRHHSNDPMECHEL
ncbi:MAG: hypothetical protein COW00_00420 [Bdellovibrio sp. CG12_big_fil_rev_8_21_14_0_65_39_13]|nr:MAG: hypothetical protein COW78_04170 [Bdellovibrio sp. CG22_combo_CG10-13_8_21_14_all_39_27]PIQ62947.1 MAG: hypothetical protein COW00_00420 [Bdellovibrio sp. CG12_big_fil_rev_8_21_14_0_65_39_13]PIR32579.1 MAG: hypothetical protein COV37_19395 [Bdellovibrio sp. CG11_big_fil_rev_8_21_14_0_20_39_38]PJB54710.1 MAG: hypothetical protein CO099_00015 [Bdellovibrio sp. CG_4_9_14_3_um_filter_39_7]